MSDHQLAHGTLALVGGGEWQEGATFDAELLADAGGTVAVLATGAAYEYPARLVERARSWFADLGGRVEEVPVLTRRDGESPAMADQVRAARFIYLVGGSPLHVRSVLKDSAVLDALIEAWRGGAVVAGSSAGAMVLSDPMVDPRGGALTVGFGLVRDVAVVPHSTDEMTAQLRRTLELAPSGCAVVALGEQSAVIRDRDGSWRLAGRARASLYVDRQPVELSVLSDRPVL